MSDAYREHIEELWAEADLLSEGPAKVVLLEEAIRLADTHGDLELGFDLRENLIEACTFCGLGEKSLVAFIWCLGQCDQHPERFSQDDLLWKYKWIINSLHKFPQIPLTQIEEALADMERRYLQAGAGKRAYYRLQADLAIHRGDRHAAEQWMQQWQKTPRDFLSDCPACEENAQVDYLIFSAHDELALQRARPLLDGRLRCQEIPHNTYGDVLLPLLRLGRAAEAMEYHRKGYRLVSRNRSFLTIVGDHMAFLALTGNLGRASKLLGKHLPWALETMELSRRFKFFLDGLILLDRLLLEKHQTAPLRLPKTCPLYQDNSSCDLARLRTWLDGEARVLAQLFDQRNGTDWFATRLEDNGRLQQYAIPVPFQKNEEDQG